MLATVEQMKKKGNFSKEDLAALGLGGDDGLDGNMSMMNQTARDHNLDDFGNSVQIQDHNNSQEQPVTDVFQTEL